MLYFMEHSKSRTPPRWYLLEMKTTEIPVSVTALRGEASLSLDLGYADGAVHESIVWHISLH